MLKDLINRAFIALLLILLVCVVIAVAGDALMIWNKEF